MSLDNKLLYEFGTFRLDAQERQLTRQGKPVHLAPQQFDLLLLLVQSPGKLLSEEDLLQRLWPDTFVEESNLAQHASMLRKALQDGEEGTRYVETVARRGYRFTTEVRLLSHSPEPLSPPSRAGQASLRQKQVWKWTLPVISLLLL